MASATSSQAEALLADPTGAVAQEMAALMPYFPFKSIPRFYDIGGLLADPVKVRHAVHTAHTLTHSLFSLLSPLPPTTISHSLFLSPLAPAQFNLICEVFATRYASMGITHIAGFDARGFLFTPVALKLGLPFIMLRKKGKMPNTISSGPYTKEYAGTSEICITRGAVGPGDRVLLIDDLVATGGTLCAGIKLIQALGATVASCGCMVELTMLGGRAKCIAAGAEDVWSFLDESILTTEAVLPAEYVDDGEAH